MTLEPEVGEELLYGEAMPAVIKWRQAQERIPGEQAAGWTTSRQRLACANWRFVLIGDHELTLPPAVYPWNRSDRRDEVWRRGEWLKDLRVERNRALVLRWGRRALTLGIWWK